MSEITGDLEVTGDVTLAAAKQVKLTGAGAIAFNTTGADPDWLLAGHVSGLGPTVRRSGGLTISLFRDDGASGALSIAYLRGEGVSDQASSYDAGGMNIVQIANTDGAETTQLRWLVNTGTGAPVETMILNQYGVLVVGTSISTSVTTNGSADLNGILKVRGGGIAAESGDVRLRNNGAIKARNAANSADLLLAQITAADLLQLRATHSAIGAETVTGYIQVVDTSGTVRKLAVVS